MHDENVLIAELVRCFLFVSVTSNINLTIRIITDSHFSISSSFAVAFKAAVARCNITFINHPLDLISLEGSHCNI